MVQLNQQQVEQIVQHLQKGKWTYQPLQEELMDHICCDIENRMERGDSFSQAVAAVFAIFSEEEIENIQQQTIFSLHYKKTIMKQISLLVLALMMLTFSSLWSFQQTPTNGNPFNGEWKMTSEFGTRMHPIHQKKMMHNGTDFSMPVGTPILATADGVVKIAKHQSEGYGNFIRLEHADIYETVYAQLSELKVEEGTFVKKGQVIALSGNSGASTAPHLHFEVSKDGKRINPQEYLKKD